jgi:hypothetical protein
MGLAGSRVSSLCWKKQSEEEEEKEEEAAVASNTVSAVHPQNLLSTETKTNLTVFVNCN